MEAVTQAGSAAGQFHTRFGGDGSLQGKLAEPKFRAVR